MKVSRLQAIISILVVSTFLIVTSIIALAPVIGGYPTEKFTKHLQEWSSLYSGIIGLIIGYHFPKKAG